MTWKRPVKFLLLRPNWAEAVRLSHQFRTTITRAKTRLEQRAALRANAKKVLKYMVDALTAGESAYLHRKIYKEMHSLLGIPLWPDMVLLTAQATAGTNILTVDDTDDCAFQTGYQVVLLDPDDPDVYEIGIVESITTTQITLVDNLANTWDPGTEIYPIMISRIQQTATLTHKTDSFSNTTIEATEWWEPTTTSTTSSTTTTTV